MTLKNRLLRVTHLLFIILLLVQLLPDKSTNEVHTGALIAAVIPVVVLICVFLVRSHKKRKRTKTNLD